MESSQISLQSIQLRQRFLKQLDQTSTSQNVNYYDFLVAAKKLQLRFEQSSHLIGLKNYFLRYNNVLSKEKLSSILVVNTKVPKTKFPGKIIVKFLLPEISFDSIKQVTDEDEESMNFDNESFVKRRRRKSVGGRYTTIEYSDKISLIVKLRVDNVMKKLQPFIKTLKENTLPLYGPQLKQNFTFDSFKKKVQKIIGEDRIKDDDLKSIFYLLDTNKNGILSRREISQLIHPQFVMSLTDFYKTRVNPDLIRSTELKRGNQSINSLQMYKAKNPWTIQLSDIEQSILSYYKPPQDMKKTTKPRFGPLRHFHLQKPQSQKIIQQKPLIRDISLQRSKIQKLMKASLSGSKKIVRNPNETITSKLRRLFVQKVILPRERMFEEYRYKEKGVSSKSFQVRHSK